MGQQLAAEEYVMQSFKKECPTREKKNSTKSDQVYYMGEGQIVLIATHNSPNSGE